MFLPTTIKEVRERGWDQLDVILFSGDAYIDHPAFGAAVIGRLLEAEGYRVAIVPQPNWRDDLRDFTKLGAPRLFFGISGGAMDSMVNHYTANLRLRHDDAYTPAGKSGFRPDRCVTVYSKILKELFPHVPVVIGGIESSLRRLTHYDYWSNSLHPSILASSGADLLIYGMGEKVIQEVARAMKNGFNAKLLRKIRQVAFLSDEGYVNRLPKDKTIFLHSFEECQESKEKFGENFTVIETLSNVMNPEATLVEKTGDEYVVVTPPNATLTTEELDHSFDLPYERAPHPRYKDKGDIPAWEMIKHSVNIHRGCFGGCSFCTISAHQGKFINSRSERSILEEVKKITQMPDFKGYLSDVGAPSANMYRMGGKNKELCSKCRRPSCLHPRMCPNLNNDHGPLMSLYEKIRQVKGIKKAFIGSGIRYDLFDDKPYLETVLKYHTSGRLKVAPEHTEDNVLKLMRKPSFTLFEQLNEDFHRICEREGLRYQLIPYFISSHPGCEECDMRHLSERVLGKLHFTLEQVQDLTPTPMTFSSVMFYTGMNPYTHEPVFVARSQEDKRRQKSYFFSETGEPLGKMHIKPPRKGSATQHRTQSKAFQEAFSEEQTAQKKFSKRGSKEMHGSKFGETQTFGRGSKSESSKFNGKNSSGRDAFRKGGQEGNREGYRDSMKGGFARHRGSFEGEGATYGKNARTGERTSKSTHATRERSSQNGRSFAKSDRNSYKSFRRK